MSRTCPLLIEMLARVRHTQDTPLDFAIDGQRIATDALRAVEARLDDLDSPGTAPEQVMQAIDALVRGVLETPAPRAAPVAPTLDSAPLADRLAAWMEQTHGRMRVVHPMALDILGLLLEGRTSREIAEHMEFGLRLTQRITADMRAAW